MSDNTKLRKASCKVCGDQGGPRRHDGLASFCRTCGKMRISQELDK